MAFAGTNPRTWENLKANFKQAVGLESRQYTLAKRFARRTSIALIGGRAISFTGHSLGGGLAAAASIAKENGATIFHVAGSHRNTVGGQAALERERSLITAYHSSFDILTVFQQLTPLPNAAVHNLPLARASLQGTGSLCGALNAC